MVIGKLVFVHHFAVAFDFFRQAFASHNACLKTRYGKGLIVP
ncbi:hypothetical protein HMPREF9370_1665 [Neisseria wadsworthii 9715]|uniref:Uncharacterized protein n=1 Tax=Neisseria wadsworthii 9715 TaxID=1030841 RepID=G4CRF5_9NEIS|nr:hypothetical protein HMPREF9370_1665 [Neisseria wadsworthii 9715]